MKPFFNPGAFIVNRIDPKTLKKHRLLPIGSIYRYDEAWEGYKCSSDELDRVHVLAPNHAFDLCSQGILDFYIQKEEVKGVYETMKKKLEELEKDIDEIEDFIFDKYDEYKITEAITYRLKKQIEENEQTR